MGLPFNLSLSANTKFLRVGEIPALTTKAIHPESEDDSDSQDLARAGCQINHEEALDKAIKARMVTPLNPLSYEQHTFPFGDALRRAIINLDDFKRFAASLQIEVVMWDEPAQTQDTDNVAGIRTHLTIREAASALAEKYGFNENTTNTMRAQLIEAAERGDITVRHPHTLLPYTPSTRRDFYELVSVADLNAWLEKQGAEYRLDSPEPEQQGQDASGKTSKVDAKKEKIRAILGKIESADGAFSREAMPGRKADFFNLCKTLEHESFAYIAQATFDDYLPGLCKFMSGARETGYYRDIAAKLG